MNIFYLISIIIGITAQNVFKKIYSRNNENGVYFFNGLISFSAMIFFTISAILIKGGLKWNMNVLPYSIAFAVSYSLSAVSSLTAISVGSLSLTSLIVQYSLMIPTLYGLFFLNDNISIGLIPGIMLLLISLVLINKKGGEIVLSFKWIISVFIAFLGNGMCSVIQKMQQVRFDGGYKDEFMIIALIMVCVFVSTLSIIYERKNIGNCAKKGWYLGLGCGIMNGMVNLFVLILAGIMPVSLMFPLISAGGIVTTYIVSKFIYKEKLNRMQFVGFILGIGSIVLMNI